MEVLHPRCCGLDVHKSTISACILLREAGRVQKQQRRFGAMTQDLRELAEWLRQFGLTQVAMNLAAFTGNPFVQRKKKRIVLNPTGLLMEGRYTQTPPKVSASGALCTARPLAFCYADARPTHSRSPGCPLVISSESVARVSARAG
jgi:hypothetical protein